MTMTKEYTNINSKTILKRCNRFHIHLKNYCRKLPPENMFGLHRGIMKAAGCVIRNNITCL